MGATVVDRIPHDQGLPQLRRLLDPREMATVLARSLPPEANLTSVRVVYLRYKPGTRLTVRYAVGVGETLHDATALAEPAVDLAAWAADPEHVALARKVDGRAPAPMPLAYDEEIGALIQWLPLDLTMPVLAVEPDELRALLAEAGVGIARTGSPPDVLAYKARRRAVLRLDAHVVKIYAGRPDFANSVLGLETSGELTGLVAPAAEAVLPSWQLTSQALLAGQPPRGHHAAARAAGEVLARLHASPARGLREFPVDRQRAAAAASARSAAAVVPELRERLDGVLDTLEQSTPTAQLVTSHGDFHANQVLELGGDLAVIDFDEICAAPAALDFSSYVAHLVTGRPGELEAAAASLADLVDGYGARPEGLAWFVATSIIRRAPFPFRFMDDDWPERIEQMVADAEEALQL